MTGTTFKIAIFHAMSLGIFPDSSNHTLLIATKAKASSLLPMFSNCSNKGSQKMSDKLEHEEQNHHMCILCFTFRNVPTSNKDKPPPNFHCPTLSLNEPIVG